ncbi:MAG: hypothetical protein C0507_15085 [Cyanobacteria bacterium PR.3.49]|nr:hypothetical protein [Cyanobacteria bacterium PR.3.49]
MLRKLNNQVFLWFLVFWSFYNASKVSDLVERAERWQTQVNLQDFSYLILILLAGYGLSWKFFFSPNRAAAPDVADKVVFREFPWARLVFSCGRLFSIVLLSSGICFFGLQTFDNLTLPLASIADSFHKYELAEAIFRHRQDRWDRHVPFSAWKSSDTPCETWDVQMRRNQAVADVFGPNSLEMANRLYHCATNFDMKTWGASPELCRDRYALALRFYQEQSSANGMVQCFSGLLGNCEPGERVKKMRVEYIKAAHQCLSSLQPSRSLFCLSIFVGCAKKEGLTQIAQDFSKREKELSCVHEKTDDSGKWFALCYMSLITLVLSNCSGLLNGCAQGLLLILASARLKKKLKASSNVDSQVSILGALVDIELASGQFVYAYRTSLRALELVSEHTKDLAKCMKNTTSPAEYRVILSELRSLALVLCILFSFGF